MKKLLLILIFLFVSTEAKSKYIALECEVKQTIYKIYDVKGRFIKNILDTSFDLKTFYFSQKYQWLNDYKINTEDLDKIKLEENKMTIEERGYKWWLDDLDDDVYHFSFLPTGNIIGSLFIDLNKDSGHFKYDMHLNRKVDGFLMEKHFYKKGYYSDSYESSGVCKKIKKSLF